MTHPIVDAAERAFMGYDRGDIYDQAGEPLAVDERMRDAILAALRAMREPSPPVAEALLKDAHPFILWAAGIDALIKEIEG